MAVKIANREVPLLAGSCYWWHYKLRPMKGCFRVDSGTSPLAVVNSRFRPEAATHKSEIEV